MSGDGVANDGDKPVATAESADGATGAIGTGERVDDQIDIAEADPDDPDSAVSPGAVVEASTASIAPSDRSDVVPNGDRSWSRGAQPDATTGALVPTDSSPPVTPPTSTPSGGRRRRWVPWVAALVGLLLGAGGAWWLGSSSLSPDEAASRAAEPAASWVTAPVEFRVLEATVIQRGDVVASSSVDVQAPASVGDGSPVVTRLPIVVGDELPDGALVVEVSGRPVFALEGDAVMYRDLAPGMTGADVTALQTALARLGYTVDPTGEFDAATKDAVTEFYYSYGYEPIPVSPTSEADIAAAQSTLSAAKDAVLSAVNTAQEAGAGASALELAGAESGVSSARRALRSAQQERSTQVVLAEEQYNATVREYDQIAANPESDAAMLDQAALAIDQAWAQLESTRLATADAVVSAEEQLKMAQLSLDEVTEPVDVSMETTAVVRATEDRDAAQAALDALVASSGPTVPFGEIVMSGSFPLTVRSTSTSTSTESPADGMGDVGGGGPSAIVELSGGALVVSTSVRPGDEEFVRVGMQVELLDEMTDEVILGTVSSVATTAVVGSSGEMAFPAVVTPDLPLPDRLVGANLRVTMVSAATEGEVLVVPLAAVTSSADGATWVSVVTDVDQEEPVEVEVVAGLSADGFVEVTPVDPAALEPGAMVVVGR